MALYTNLQKVVRRDLMIDKQTGHNVDTTWLQLLQLVYSTTVSYQMRLSEWQQTGHDFVATIQQLLQLGHDLVMIWLLLLQLVYLTGVRWENLLFNASFFFVYVRTCPVEQYLGAVVGVLPSTMSSETWDFVENSLMPDRVKATT